MLNKPRLILVAYSIFVVVLFAFLFQSVNGFDKSPSKVLKGDTLIEYVTDRFNGNTILTLSAFERFPAPYKYVVRCYNEPIVDCSQKIPLEPPSNVLLANTDNDSMDGDTITTRGQDILINKPSGQIDRLPLVSDDQLALKKYTQIVQNMLTAGILIIVGLLLVPLTFSGRGSVDGSVLFYGVCAGFIGTLGFYVAWIVLMQGWV